MLQLMERRQIPLSMSLAWSMQQRGQKQQQMNRTSSIGTLPYCESLTQQEEAKLKLDT